VGPIQYGFDTSFYWMQTKQALFRTGISDTITNIYIHTLYVSQSHHYLIFSTKSFQFSSRVCP
jgi:hypothetical protein